MAINSDPRIFRAATLNLPNGDCTKSMRQRARRANVYLGRRVTLTKTAMPLEAGQSEWFRGIEYEFEDCVSSGVELVSE